MRHAGGLLRRASMVVQSEANGLEARLRPIDLDCKEEHSYELSVRLLERLRCDLILEHCERVPGKLTTRRRGD
jgi:hypothetical protein